MDNYFVTVAISVLIAAVIILSLELSSSRKKTREAKEARLDAIKLQKETVHLLDESYDRERTLMDRNDELVELGASYGSIATLLYDYIWGHTADTEKELKNSRRGWMLREVMETSEWKDILNNHEWLTATEWGEEFNG